jgi:hypothetical protein
MHPKVFVKLKKTLNTFSSGLKNPKNPKYPLGWVKKKPGFFQPWRHWGIGHWDEWRLKNNYCNDEGHSLKPDDPCFLWRKR